VLSAREAPRFAYDGQRYVLIAWMEASADERAVALPVAQALRVFESASTAMLLDSWFQPAGDLRRIAEDLRLCSPFEGRRMRAQTLYEGMHQLVRAGRLLVIPFDRIPRPVRQANAGDRDPTADLPFDAPAPTPFSWIEIHVIDKGDRPLAGVRVRVRDPEGGIREVKSDERGFVRLNLPAGRCQVELPGLDSASWNGD
jgi:hypothetical protein